MHRFMPIEEEEEPQGRWRAIRLLACRSRADDTQDLLDRFECGNPDIRSSFSTLGEDEVSKKDSLNERDSYKTARYVRNELPLSPGDPLKRVLDGDTDQGPHSQSTEGSTEERSSATENSLPFRTNPRDFTPLSAIPVHRCESPSGTSQPPIPCREPTVLTTDCRHPTANRMPKYSMLPPPRLAYHSRRQQLSRRIEGGSKLAKDKETEGKPNIRAPAVKLPRDTPNESWLTNHSDRQRTTITDTSRLWETTLDISREWWKPQGDATEPSASRSDDSSEQRERREPSSNHGSSIVEEFLDGRESTEVADTLDSRLGSFNHTVAPNSVSMTRAGGHLRYQRWSTLAENQDKKSSPTFQAYKKSLQEPKVAVYDAISPSKGYPKVDEMSKRAQNTNDKIPPENETWNRTWAEPPLQKPPRSRISGPTGQYKITVTTIRASQSSEQSL